MHISSGAGQPAPVRPQRLLKLESLLKSGSAWGVKQLAQLFGVCQRTIRRDFRLLRRCGIPIVFDPNRDGYRVLVGDGRSLEGLNIEVAELVALVLAVKHISNLPDCFAEPCDMAIAKIMQAVTPEVRQQALAILDFYPPRFNAQPDRLELLSNGQDLETGTEESYISGPDTLELPQRQSG